MSTEWKDDATAVTSLEGYWQDTGEAPMHLILYAEKKGWIKRVGKTKQYEWTPAGTAFLERSQ